jgi:hypothetical protein
MPTREDILLTAYCLQLSTWKMRRAYYWDSDRFVIENHRTHLELIGGLITETMRIQWRAIAKHGTVAITDHLGYEWCPHTTHEERRAELEESLRTKPPPHRKPRVRRKSEEEKPEPESEEGSKGSQA